MIIMTLIPHLKTNKVPYNLTLQTLNRVRLELRMNDAQLCKSYFI